MIQTGWDHLRRAGEMSHKELLNELHVKRSAFVCALISLFPEVSFDQRAAELRHCHRDSLKRRKTFTS